MKCSQCKLIEMRVMVRNDKEVVYHCPKCKDIVTITVEKEKELFEEEQKRKKEFSNTHLENSNESAE